jgi:Mrp family chromosome partitioning ATPase
VTTPSKVAYETVRKQLALLKRLQVSVIGVVENMVRKPSEYIFHNLENDGALYLGAIGYDEGLEESLGDEARLKETKFYAEASKLYSKII